MLVLKCVKPIEREKITYKSIARLHAFWSTLNKKVSDIKIERFYARMAMQYVVYKMNFMCFQIKPGSNAYSPETVEIKMNALIYIGRAIIIA